MASVYKVQVVLEHDSALPEDVTVNTWCVTTPATGNLAALEDFVGELQAFYETVDAQLSSRLSGIIRYKAYDLSDPTPRVPVYQAADTITPGTSAAPGQLSICMSFQGVTASGLPQARRRGRVYLGPVNVESIAPATGRLEAGTRGAVATAGDTLVTVSKAATDWEWSVFSDTNNSAVSVDNGWVDDKFDTQRRRAERALLRSTFS